MTETEDTYLQKAVVGAREFKRTGDTGTSLEWIDDLEGIAIHGSHQCSIDALRELHRLAKSPNVEINTKAGMAVKLAMATLQD